MGDLVNLRLARKRKARSEAEDQAAENRALYGRSKGERQLLETEKQKAAKSLDGHKRGKP